MRKHEDESVSNALLQLLHEERETKRRSTLFPLLVLLISGIVLSFFSFLFYKEEEGGAFLLAKEALSDFLEDNEALAVFLGLDETDEVR